MKYIWIICLVALCSCNTINDDQIVEEDYETLFPPKDIEEPENVRGEMHVQFCDPNLALHNYKYPGEETPSDAEQYEVTLTCSFQEKDINNIFVDEVTSLYEIKYIDSNKELKIIRCGNISGGSSEPNTMYNGRTFSTSFKVQSGYPLYLSISGAGPRGSNVKAKLEAVSSDGLIEIPVLESVHYQNKEGIINLQNPYCEYIVLP